GDLGDYFGHKIRAATVLAVYMQSGVQSYLDLARTETTAATDAWKKLADDTAYIQPFKEQMRLGREIKISPFHWEGGVAWIPDDLSSIDNVASAVKSSPPPTPNPPLAAAGTWATTARPAGPGLASLTVDPPDFKATSWTVTVTLASAPAAGSTVRVLWKPL